MYGRPLYLSHSRYGCPISRIPLGQGGGTEMTLERLGNLLWNPWLLGLFLVTGLYLSVRTGFFQIFRCGVWCRATLGSLGQEEQRGKSGLTRMQAMSTALAATIGTGSIAGVATAIFYGGPGAVFWMWVSALLGMMIGCVEKTLAIRYRTRDRAGRWQGGPMIYMEQGLGNKSLAMLFALCCVASCLGGGNMVQSNSIAAALWSAFGWDRLTVGVVVALLTGLVIVGGVGRIGRVSETLVPCLARLFVGGGLVVLACRWQALPAAFAQIMAGAFCPQAVLGGGAGYGVAAALRYGVARGVFTNEAGIGTSAIAHAAADTREPAEQGMWGIFEVFVATVVVCSVTALVVLTTGVYSPQQALDAIHSGQVDPQMVGAPLSAAGFSAVFGPFGGIFVSVCLLLFAFTSLLGCSYYGERSLAYLVGEGRGRGVYRLVFLGAIVWGSVADVSAVWQLADIFNGLMALPNLCTLLLLSPQAIGLLKKWLAKTAQDF